MKTLLLLLLPIFSFAQLPTTGSLSIKSAAGAGRSISQQVDGNETGNKSLTTLSTSAGLSAPHSMLEFRGYPPSTPPDALLACDAINDNPNGIKFTWTLASSGPGAEAILMTLVTGTTNGWIETQYNIPSAGTFTVNGANFINGNTYTFNVSACNDSDNDGSWDDCSTPCATGSVSYNPPPDPPGAPQNVTATNTGSAILVDWNAPSSGGDVEVYMVEKMVDGSGTWFSPPASTTTDTQFSDGGVITGHNYKYRVRAANSAGQSAFVESNIEFF